MQEQRGNERQSQAKLKDLVVLTFVEDTDQAREYETLLKVNDIPAVIREQIDPSGDAKGVALMVPEEYLDEAHVVIESQDAYDDFYDMTLDDDQMEDLDEDLDEDF